MNHGCQCFCWCCCVCSPPWAAEEFGDLQTTEDDLISRNDAKQPGPVSAQFPQFLQGLVGAGNFPCGIRFGQSTSQ